jgi:hypothetical protein
LILLLEFWLIWLLTTVGVTGSGRGMTEVASKAKNKFDYSVDDS